MPSTIHGQKVILPVTANVSWNDGGHASPTFPVGCGMGINKARDWGDVMPLYPYVVNQDDTPDGLGWFFARKPNFVTTPQDGYIHDITAAGTWDEEESITGIWEHNAGMAQKPCVCFGSFRAYWYAETGGYENPGALTLYDGIGKEYAERSFSLSYGIPPGQMGDDPCADNKIYSTMDGTTVLDFDITASYSLTWQTCTCHYMVGPGYTNGADGALLRIAIPLHAREISVGYGYGIINGVHSALFFNTAYPARNFVSGMYANPSASGQIYDNIFTNISTTGFRFDIAYPI